MLSLTSFNNYVINNIKIITDSIDIIGFLAALAALYLTLVSE